MDFAAIVLAARTAINAATELRDLYNEHKANFSSEQEAELQAYLTRLRGLNDDLYASVDAKLAAASGADTQTG